MRIVANVPILYQGVQYMTGDTVDRYDAEALHLWLLYKSVTRVEDEEAEMIKEPVGVGLPPVLDFKAQVEQDLRLAFHNAREHADMATVVYEKKTYQLAVVFDYDGARDREKYRDDHGEGLFYADVRVYIMAADLPTTPRKNRKIGVNGETYRIVRVARESGELALDLEMLDE